MLIHKGIGRIKKVQNLKGKKPFYLRGANFELFFVVKSPVIGQQFIDQRNGKFVMVNMHFKIMQHAGKMFHTA